VCIQHIHLSTLTSECGCSCGGVSVGTAGADIKEISQLDAEGAHQKRYLEDLCNGMQRVRKPVIAAVEGKAVSRMNSNLANQPRAD
jgi:hypothetical protein